MRASTEPPATVESGYAGFAPGHPVGADGQHPIPASVSPRAGATSISRVAVSAVLGFVVGAVFWHFVGFWDFVRNVVLKGPERAASHVLQTGPECSSLVLDRSTGAVRVDTCPMEAAWLTEATGGSKADMLVPTRPVAAKRWSVTVQAEATASEE